LAGKRNPAGDPIVDRSFLLSGERNVGQAERWLSLAGGAALILRGMARPSMASALLGLAGVALVHRGVTGHCAVYDTLGFDTSGEDARAEPPRGRRSIRDHIEDASGDSFPASDPPSWTPTSSLGAPGARTARSNSR
jgi:hypothetical protein